MDVVIFVKYGDPKFPMKTVVLFFLHFLVSDPLSSVNRLRGKFLYSTLMIIDHHQTVSVWVPCEFGEEMVRGPFGLGVPRQMNLGPLKKS